jgi:uncharacterized protein YecT (DUF1311 family)
MKKIAVVLAAAFIPMAAHAAGCAKPRNAFDQVYCASTVFSQADRDLNAQYGRLRTHLNPAQQASLKSGQLQWLKQRDQQCSEEKESGYFVNLDCAVNMTQERLAFLQERERECNSTGCVNDKLGQ